MLVSVAARLRCLSVASDRARSLPPEMAGLSLGFSRVPQQQGIRTTDLFGRVLCHDDFPSVEGEPAMPADIQGS